MPGHSHLFAEIMDVFVQLDRFIPGSSTKVGDFLIGHLPDANPAEIYELADAWGEVAKRLRDFHESLPPAAKPIIEGMSGDGAPLEFRLSWVEYLQNVGGLTQGIADLQQAVHGYGLELEMEEFFVAITLIQLIVALISAIISTIFGGPIGLAEAGTAFYVAKTTIQTLFKKTVEAIARMEAKTLAAALAKNLGKALSKDFAKNLAKDLGRKAAVQMPRAAAQGAKDLGKAGLKRGWELGRAGARELPRYARDAVARTGRTYFTKAGLVNNFGIRHMLARQAGQRVARQYYRNVLRHELRRELARQIARTEGRAAARQAARTLARGAADLTSRMAADIEKGILARAAERGMANATERGLVRATEHGLAQTAAERYVAERVAATTLRNEAGRMVLGKSWAGFKFMAYREVGGQLYTLATGERSSLDLGRMGVALGQGALMGGLMFGHGLPGHILTGAMAGAVVAGATDLYQKVSLDVQEAMTSDPKERAALEKAESEINWGEDLRKGAIDGAQMGATFHTLGAVRGTAAGFGNNVMARADAMSAARRAESLPPSVVARAHSNIGQETFTIPDGRFGDNMFTGYRGTGEGGYITESGHAGYRFADGSQVHISPEAPRGPDHSAGTPVDGGHPPSRVIAGPGEAHVTSLSGEVAHRPAGGGGGGPGDGPRQPVRPTAHTTAASADVRSPAARVSGVDAPARPDSPADGGRGRIVEGSVVDAGPREPAADRQPGGHDLTDSAGPREAHDRPVPEQSSGSHDRLPPSERSDGGPSSADQVTPHDAGTGDGPSHRAPHGESHQPGEPPAEPHAGDRVESPIDNGRVDSPSQRADPPSRPPDGDGVTKASESGQTGRDGADSRAAVSHSGADGRSGESGTQRRADEISPRDSTPREPTTPDRLLPESTRDALGDGRTPDSLRRDIAEHLASHDTRGDAHPRPDGEIAQTLEALYGEARTASSDSLPHGAEAAGHDGERWAAAAATGTDAADRLAFGERLYRTLVERAFPDRLHEADPAAVRQVGRAIAERILRTPEEHVQNVEAAKILKDFVREELTARTHGEEGHRSGEERVDEARLSRKVDEMVESHRVRAGEHQDATPADRPAEPADQFADHTTADALHPVPDGPGEPHRQEFTRTFVERRTGIRPDGTHGRVVVRIVETVERSWSTLEFARPAGDQPGGLRGPEAHQAVHRAAQELAGREFERIVDAAHEWLTDVGREPGDTELGRVGGMSAAVLLHDGTLTAATSVRERTIRVEEPIEPDRTGWEQQSDAAKARAIDRAYNDAWNTFGSRKTALQRDDPARHWAVQRVLDEVPGSQRSKTHGKCAEPTLIDRVVTRIEADFRRTYEGTVEDSAGRRHPEYESRFLDHLQQRMADGVIASHRNTGEPIEHSEQYPCATDDKVIESFGLRSDYVDRMLADAHVDVDRGLVVLVAEGDPLRAHALRLGDAHPDHVLVVVHGQVHGDRINVRVGDEHFSSVEVARVIKTLVTSHPELAGRKVLLLSCDGATNVKGVHGWTTLAREVAIRNGMPVSGATGPVWISSHGRIEVSSTASDVHGHDRFSVPRPRAAEQPAWREYSPNGEHTAADAGDVVRRMSEEAAGRPGDGEHWTSAARPGHGSGRERMPAARGGEPFGERIGWHDGTVDRGAERGHDPLESAPRGSDRTGVPHEARTGHDGHHDGPSTHERGGGVEPAWERDGRRPSIAELFPPAGHEAAHWAPAIERAIAAELAGRDFGGLGVRIDRVHVTGGRITVHLDITHPDHAGRVGRIVEELLRDGQDLEVQHVTLKVQNSDLQGTGFARRFNDHLEGWYAESGVSRISLRAAMDVGGYAWARDGYGWDLRFGPENADRCIARLGQERNLASRDLDVLTAGLHDGRSGDVAAVIRRHGATDPDQLAADLYRQVHAAEEVIGRARRHAYGSEGFPTPYEISQAGRGGEQGKHATWVGKRAMLGADWRGARAPQPRPAAPRIATAPHDAAATVHRPSEVVTSVSEHESPPHLDPRPSETRPAVESHQAETPDPQARAELLEGIRHALDPEGTRSAEPAQDTGGHPSSASDVGGPEASVPHAESPAAPHDAVADAGAGQRGEAVAASRTPPSGVRYEPLAGPLGGADRMRTWLAIDTVLTNDHLMAGTDVDLVHRTVTLRGADGSQRVVHFRTATVAESHLVTGAGGVRYQPTTSIAYGEGTAVVHVSEHANPVSIRQHVYDSLVDIYHRRGDHVPDSRTVPGQTDVVGRGHRVEVEGSPAATRQDLVGHRESPVSSRPAHDVGLRPAAREANHALDQQPPVDPRASERPPPDALADRALAEAARNEPAISDAVRAVAREAGGISIGHGPTADPRAFRQRLAAEFAETAPGRSVAHGADPRSSLHYAVELPERGYVEAAQRVLDDLAARGYEPLRLVDGWRDGQPGGLVSRWRDSVTDQRFTLRLDTADSQAAHDAVRRWHEIRQLAADHAYQQQVELRAREAVDRLRVPDGADQIRLPHEPGEWASHHSYPDGHPERLPLVYGPEAVQALRDFVHQTPSGGLDFTGDPRMHRYADALHAEPGKAKITLHGLRSGTVVVGRFRMSAEDFASGLREMEREGRIDLGQRVKLVSCYSGRGGDRSLAAVLARGLGREVTGATEKVWTYLDGTEKAASPDPHNGRVPTHPPDGRWPTFGADGRELPPASAHVPGVGQSPHAAGAGAASPGPAASAGVTQPARPILYRGPDNRLHAHGDVVGSYRTDDGSLHFEGDRRHTYRDPTTGRLHHELDGGETYRSGRRFRLVSAETGRVVSDPLADRTQPAAHHADEGPRELYRSTSRADGVANAQRVLAARREALRNFRQQSLRPLMDELGVSDHRQLSRSARDETLRALRDRYVADPRKRVLINDLQAAAEEHGRLQAAVRRAATEVPRAAARHVLADRFGIAGEDVLAGGTPNEGRQPGEFAVAGFDRAGHRLVLLETTAPRGTSHVLQDGSRTERGTAAYVRDILETSPRLHDHLRQHPEILDEVHRALRRGDLTVEYHRVEVDVDGQHQAAVWTRPLRVDGLDLDGLADHLPPASGAPDPHLDGRLHEAAQRVAGVLAAPGARHGIAGVTVLDPHSVRVEPGRGKPYQLSIGFGGDAPYTVSLGADRTHRIEFSQHVTDGLDQAGLDRLVARAIGHANGEVAATTGGRLGRFVGLHGGRLSAHDALVNEPVPARRGRMSHRDLAHLGEFEALARMHAHSPAEHLDAVTADIRRFIEDHALREGMPGAVERVDLAAGRLSEGARALLAEQRAWWRDSDPAAAGTRKLLMESTLVNAAVKPVAARDTSYFRIEPHGWRETGRASFTIELRSGPVADGRVAEFRATPHFRHFELVVNRDAVDLQGPGRIRFSAALKAVFDERIATQQVRAEELPLRTRDVLAHNAPAATGGATMLEMAHVLHSEVLTTKGLATSAVDLATNKAVLRRITLDRVERQHDRALAHLPSIEADRSVVQERLDDSFTKAAAMAEAVLGDRSLVARTVHPEPEASLERRPVPEAEARPLRELASQEIVKINRMLRTEPIEYLRKVRPLSGARYRLVVRGDGNDAVVHVEVARTGRPDRIEVSFAPDRITMLVPPELGRIAPHDFHAAVRAALTEVAERQHAISRDEVGLRARVADGATTELQQDIPMYPVAEELAPNLGKVIVSSSVARAITQAVADRILGHRALELADLRERFDQEQSSRPTDDQRRNLGNQLVELTGSGAAVGRALLTSITGAAQPATGSSAAAAGPAGHDAAVSAVRTAMVEVNRRHGDTFRMTREVHDSGRNLTKVVYRSDQLGWRYDAELHIAFGPVPDGRPVVPAGHRVSGGRFELIVNSHADPARIASALTHIADNIMFDREHRIPLRRRLYEDFLPAATRLATSAGVALASHSPAAGGLAAVGAGMHAATRWLDRTRMVRQHDIELNKTLLYTHDEDVPPAELRDRIATQRDPVEALEWQAREIEQRLARDPRTAGQVSALRRALGDIPVPGHDVLADVARGIFTSTELPRGARVATVNGVAHTFRVVFTGANGRPDSLTFDLDAGRVDGEGAVAAYRVDSDVTHAVRVDPTRPAPEIIRGVREWLATEIDRIVAGPTGLPGGRARLLSFAREAGGQAFASSMSLAVGTHPRLAHDISEQGAWVSNAVVGAGAREITNVSLDGHQAVSDLTRTELARRHFGTASAEHLAVLATDADHLMDRTWLAYDRIQHLERIAETLPLDQRPHLFQHGPVTGAIDPVSWGEPGRAGEDLATHAAHLRTDTGDVDRAALRELLDRAPTVHGLSGDHPGQSVAERLHGDGVDAGLGVARRAALLQFAADALGRPVADVALERIGGEGGAKGASGAPVFWVRDAGGQPIAVVKVFGKADEFAREFSAIQRLHGESFDRLAVPEILGVGRDSESTTTVLISSVAVGRPLDDLMLAVRDAPPGGRDAVVAELMRAFRDTGAALAEMHNRPTDAGGEVAGWFTDRYATARTVDAVREWASHEPFQRLFGFDGADLIDRFTELGEATRREPGGGALVHGDPHPGNFFHDPLTGRVTVIDLEGMHTSMDAQGRPVGIAALDVGVFEQVVSAFAHNFGVPGLIPELRRNFFEGYLDAGGRPLPERALTYYRAAGLALALHGTRRMMFGEVPHGSAITPENLAARAHEQLTEIQRILGRDEAPTDHPPRHDGMDRAHQPGEGPRDQVDGAQGPERPPAVGDPDRPTGAHLPGDVRVMADREASGLPPSDPRLDALAAIRAQADRLSDLVQPARASGDLAPLRVGLRELSDQVRAYGEGLPDPLHPDELAARVFGVDPATSRFHVLDQAIVGVLAEDVFDAHYAAHLVDQMARAVPMDPELAGALLGERGRRLATDMLTEHAEGVYRYAGYSASLGVQFIRPHTPFIDAASVVAHEGAHALQPNRIDQRRQILETVTTAWERDVALARLTIERERPAYTRQREFLLGLIRRASTGEPDATVAARLAPRYAWLLGSETDIEVKIVARYIYPQPNGKELIRAVYDRDVASTPVADELAVPERPTRAQEFWHRLTERVGEVAERRGTTAQEELQQFVLQRVMARVFTAHPGDWMIKGGQTLLARWSDGRSTSDIDLVGYSNGSRAEMVDRYTEALAMDLGDHLTFELTYDGQLQHGLGARLKHLAFVDGREVGEVSVDLAPPRSRPMWAEPDLVAFPEHILSTGVEGESPRLRLISLTDTLAHKVSGMYTQGVKTEQTKCDDCLFRTENTWTCQTGDLPYRVQDLVDTLMIAGHRPWDARTLQAMLREEFTWRIEQGEPLRVPNKFYVPNPEWHEGFAKYADATPGLPFRTLDAGVPVARAFLDPLLDRVHTATGVWDPARRQWVQPEHQPEHQPVVDRSARPQQRVLVVAHISGRAAGKGGLPVASAEITKALAGLDNTEVTLLVIGETEPHGNATIISVPPDPDPKVSPRVQLLELSSGDAAAILELPPPNSDSFDVVIGHSRFSGWAAMQIRNRWYPSAALVDVLHMPMERYAELQGWPERGIEYAQREAVVFRNSELVVGVGPLLTDVARAMTADSVRPPSFHELIPGVETLGELGEPPAGDKINLLFVGRADDVIKGYDDLVATVAELHNRGFPVRLRVRGIPADQLVDQQHRADAIVGTPGVVELRGYTVHRSDLLDDYRWAHAAVVPSKIEGYGLVGAEAAVHGLPVLVNEESGFGQFLLDGGRIPARLGGVSVVRDSGLAEDLHSRIRVWSEAIVDLRRGYDQRRAGAAELKAILAEYTWHHAAKALSEAVLDATPGAGQVTVQGPAGQTLSRQGTAAVDQAGIMAVPESARPATAAVPETTAGPYPVDQPLAVPPAPIPSAQRKAPGPQSTGDASP